MSFVFYHIGFQNESRAPTKLPEYSFLYFQPPEKDEKQNDEKLFVPSRRSGRERRPEW